MRRSCDFSVSSHKTDRVAAFLTQHPRVQIHYTPTYSSWLNQVENWFSRIPYSGAFPEKSGKAPFFMQGCLEWHGNLRLTSFEFDKSGDAAKRLPFYPTR